MLDSAYSDVPLCPNKQQYLTKIYWNVSLSVLGGYIQVLIMLCIKLIHQDDTDKRAPLQIAFNVIFMSLIANALCLDKKSGICIDSFGVPTPVSLWGEWIASTPLLVFITVTVDERPSLTWQDWATTSAMLMSILFGLLIVIDQRIETAALWLALSVFFFIPIICLPRHFGHASQIYRSHQMFRSGRRDRKLKWVTIWLTIMLTLFPINYLFALFKWYDISATLAIFQVLGLFTKGTFCIAVMDIHLDLILDTEKKLVEEMRSNESRRAFMKYIFHEIRTPLNSLSMGIDFITTGINVDDMYKESLLTMKKSSDSMSDTLYEVLDCINWRRGVLSYK